MNRSMTSPAPTGYPWRLLRLLCAATLFASIQACGGGGGGDDGGGDDNDDTPPPDAPGSPGDPDDPNEPEWPTALNGELSGKVYYDAPENYVELDLATGVVRSIHPDNGGTPSEDDTEFVDQSLDPLSGSNSTSDLLILDRQGVSKARIERADFFYGRPKLSPDKSLIAVGWDSPDHLYLFKRNGDSLGFYDGVTDWDWGPDGKLYYINGDNLFVSGGDYSSANGIAPFPGETPDFLSVSPDGTQIALTLGDTGTLDNHVYVMNADGSGLRQLTTSSLNEDGATWSADGTHVIVRQGIAYAGHIGGIPGAGCPELWAVPVDAETVDLSADDPAPAARILQLEDGETRNVCAFGPPEWRTPPAEPLPHVAGTAPSGGGLNAGLDGRLFMDVAEAIAYIDVNDGGQQTIPTADDLDSRPYASWDGSEISYITDSEDIDHRRINIQTLDGEITASVDALDFFGGTPKLSPDGELIAVEWSSYDAGDPSGVQIVTVFARNGDIAARFPDKDEWSWLPDGRLALADRNQLFVSDGSLSSTSPIAELPDDVEDLEASPDGHFLAFAMDGHVWTIGIDGEGLKQLTISRHADHSPAWSPDGRYLAVITEDTCPEVHIVPADGERVHIAEPAVDSSAIRMQKLKDNGDARNVCAFSALSWRE